MSYPFFIWTMQRTGGTALTDLLMQMSEHPQAEHEPFNWARKKPRQFWPITEAWGNTKNEAQLNASLDEIFVRFIWLLRGGRLAAGASATARACSPGRRS